MKKMIKIRLNLVLGILVTLIIISCNSDTEQDKISELKAEVIEIHDKAMAKMGEIMQLKRELGKLKNESDEDSLIFSNLSDLTNAHDGMMSWMRGFSARFPEGTLMGGHNTSKVKNEIGDNEFLTEALEEELKKVKVVANDIDKAIANAQLVLVKRE